MVLNPNHTTFEAERITTEKIFYSTTDTKRSLTIKVGEFI